MSDQSDRMTATDEADQAETQQAGLREPVKTTATATASAPTNEQDDADTEGVPVGGAVDAETPEEGRDVGTASGEGIEADLTTPVDRPRDSTREEQPPSAPRSAQQAAAEAE